MHKVSRKWMGLTAALLICLTAAGCGSSGSEINVTTAKVKSEAVLYDAVYTGMVKARSMEEVTADVTGKVTEIDVKEGQSVKAGDVLFRLDDTEYALQVEQARAALHAAQTALSSARATQSSEAGVIPAKTASADAHANYERMKQLYDAGGISEADFEAARSKMETADAQLSAAEISQQSSGDSAAAQVESARASYELAAQRLSDCTVTAPIDGQVSQITINSGSVVSAQTPAMEVVDNSQMKVGVEVLEKDVEQILEGMAAQITVQSLGKTCEGTVYEVSPSADAKTGMFLVSVIFEPDGSGVLAGMTADVRLTGTEGEAAAGSGSGVAGASGSGSGAAGASGSGQAASALYVPEKSVTTEKDGAYVYTVKDGHAKKQKVEIGVRKNQYMEILKGISEGDEVIVQAGGELKDGAAVTVLKN